MSSALSFMSLERHSTLILLSRTFLPLQPGLLLLIAARIHAHVQFYSTFFHEAFHLKNIPLQLLLPPLSAPSPYAACRSSTVVGLTMSQIL